MRTEAYNVFLQTISDKTKIAARDKKLSISRSRTELRSERGGDMSGTKNLKSIGPLEERIEPGEDAETRGDDLELEFLILPFVDFLPGVIRGDP
jgi:hypothetical protein